MDSQPAHRVKRLRVTRRQQIWGAVAALAVAIFYALALPAISTAGDSDPDLTPGEPYEVVNGVTIVPAPGWSLSNEGEIISTLSRGPAALAILAAAPATGDPSQVIGTTVERLESDLDRQWVLGDPEQGETDAGAEFVAVEGHAVDEIEKIWVIDDGVATTTVGATAPESVWIQYAEEIEEMALSVQFVPDP